MDVEPGARVTISATRADDAGRDWTAVGEFVADTDGVVDADMAPSFGQL
jgi:hypothetical protein